MRKQAALLGTTATTLWAVVAISVWTHVRGPANAALIGAAATATLAAVVILAVRWSLDESRKQMDILSDRLGLLVEHSEITELIRAAEKPAQQEPAPKPRRSVHVTDNNGDLMIIGVEDGVDPDVNATQNAIQQQRHNAAS